MAKLLVVDPLDITLTDARGACEWRSRLCFERAFGELEGIDTIYCSGRDPELCRLASSANAVVLGGSEAAAWIDSPFNDHLLDLIAICRIGEMPLLGICYGAQLLARALGGRVGQHPGGIELGAPSIRLAESGKSHFLFEGLSADAFRSIESHADAILDLPQDCEVLASTEHTPIQAFAYRNQFFGLQFHPEMGGGDLRFLWRAFGAGGLVPVLSEEQKLQVATCSCPSRPRILRNFARWSAKSAERRNPSWRLDAASSRSV